jgi:hypothetical protein
MLNTLKCIKSVKTLKGLRFKKGFIYEASFNSVSTTIFKGNNDYWVFSHESKKDLDKLKRYFDYTISRIKK